MSLERIVRYLSRTEEAIVDEVRPLACGVALLTPSLPLVWQLNAVRADDPHADAGELMELADRELAAVGHRKLVVHGEELGARLTAPLAAAGWNAYRLLVMVHSAAPQRTVPAGAAAEVDRETGAAVLTAFRREQPFGWQEDAVRQLARMDDRYGAAVHARDFAAPPQRPVSSCRLYTADGLAQVDEVGTLESERGRGHASAAVSTAVARAAAEGADPIFLLTDAADWPQRLYERLGFRPVGAVYEFLKLPLSGGRP